MTRTLVGLSAIILLEILLLFIGCQSGGDNPLVPASPSGTNGTGTGIQGTSGPGEVVTPPMLWGLYRVAYDSGTREITPVPLRGPEFALNVVQFLQPPMGTLSGMTIGVLDDSSFLTDGRIDIRIILHHPFPGQSEYTGFDVCGVFLTNGSETSVYDSSLNYANSLYDPTVLNPDGYTRWMNPSEFLSGGVLGYEGGFWGTSESSENSGFVAGATLNPYKYFAQGLGSNVSIHSWMQSPISVENRGIFPSGGTCSRDYFLQFPLIGGKVQFVFNYAVLASWDQPTVNPPDNPAVDFPSSANASWPIHVVATDNSNAYYTSGESGGTVAVELEIFDWNAIDNIAGVPGEINRFVIWCNDPLIEGGWKEVMSTEVEWNSGFLAGASLAAFEVDAHPEYSGEVLLWIEIQSAGGLTYNQGFGAAVPDGPVCSYARVVVDIKTCPKAGAGTIGAGDAGAGEYLDNVIVTGENFVDGPDLGLWLELVEGTGEADTGDPYTIEATDVQYINETSIQCDLDLTQAPYGSYGVGCRNGCGTITSPIEQPGLDPLEKFMVKLESPLNVSLRTNRTGPEPMALEDLTIAWNPVKDAKYYRIYAIIYDVNGNKIGQGSIIGTAASPTHSINLSTLPNGASGILELWVTSLPGLTDPKLPFESKESAHAFAYMQNFEIGMGWWKSLASDPVSWRFIRSTVNCAYAGGWGLKGFGHPLELQWILLEAPTITDIPGADTVRVEFVHRYYNFDEESGYQAGWLLDSPSDGSDTVSDYTPVPTVSEGYAYNDTDSPALRNIFGCSVYNDNNWQTNDPLWEGWWFSAFDYTEILGDGVSNIPAIVAAVNGNDNPEICIDDIAILVF